MQEGIVKVHTAAETGLPSGATVTVLTFPSALLSPLPAPTLLSILELAYEHRQRDG